MRHALARSCALLVFFIQKEWLRLGRRVRPKELERCQVALRFPDPLMWPGGPAVSFKSPLGAELRSGDPLCSRRIALSELQWHTDGCRSRQCSRHPFSLLVGVALTDTMEEASRV